MSDLGFVPKHLLVANRIREEIISGKLQVGDRLKPDTELALQYGINKQTVANGMAELVREGLISRAPKRGSLVIDSTPGQEKRSNAVGLLARSSGHLYEDMARVINQGLVRHNLYPVWINHQLFLDTVKGPGNQNILKLLDRLIADNPFGLIVDGDRFMPFDAIKKNLDKVKRVVFVHHYLHEERLSGSYVLADFGKVGKIMAEHLAKNGHRRIGYLTPMQEIRGAYYETAHEIVCRAMQKYCQKNGLQFADEISERCFSGESPESILSDMRNRQMLPTGFGTHSDVFALYDILPVLEKLELNVPEDISLVGVGDTPWSLKMHPRLTTVSLNPAEMGDKAVSCLFAPENTEYLVKPELIIRESVKNPKP